MELKTSTGNYDRNVLWLHDHGKHVCYFSEFDPFSGKWLGLMPNKMAEYAINQIKTLCLIFHHVIFPPVYILQNLAAPIVFRKLKALFEHGCISVSIDTNYRNHPWDYFDEKIEKEIKNSHDNRKSDRCFYEKHTKKELREIVEEGFFLFRDHNVQIKGFSDDATRLFESLKGKGEGSVKEFTEGIEPIFTT